MEKLLPAKVDGFEVDDDEDQASTKAEDGAAAAPPPPSLRTKIGTAVFYGTSSLAVVFVNKIVLSEYGFPSVLFLALLQFVSTTAVLWTCARMGCARLLPLNGRNLGGIVPLSTFFLLNIITGLSATKSLPLPMMVLLRRAAIPMTMLLEKWMLQAEPSRTVQVSVGLMLGGALVAALGDLAFNLWGYVVIFFNDVFTALNGVLLKRASSEYKAHKLSVLFFNSLLSSVGVAIILGCKRGELQKVLEFNHWNDPMFVFHLVMASAMGSVLNYSIFLCTHANSALTTTVVGCLKNILTSYLGMFVGGDYIFSWLNFLGINISIVGSLIYAQANFRG